MGDIPAVRDTPSAASLFRTRAAGAAGAAWGIALLAGARRFVGGAPAAVVLTRLLGARYLAQSVALTVAPGPSARIVRGVDAVHALSMVVLVGSARYRRSALISAAVAVGLAALAGTGPYSTSTTVRR